MKKKTRGIHHISAIVGNPQENVDFYAGVLGLRFVKKTVNFDDPGTYHFYFGNESGSPGTIMTFFPWPDAYQGRIGDGQVGTTTYVVPVGALPFWQERLQNFAIPFTQSTRFNESYLQFDDPHGLHIELVERNEGNRSEWGFNGVTADVAIKGFGGAVLLSREPEKTADLLVNVLGLELVGEEGDFIRFRSIGEIGNIVEIKKSPVGRGRWGVGTVHHIAFRANDDLDQLGWQKWVADHGYGVTEVKDRSYFNAMYFREHGEILFEIATDPPGFAIDETMEDLGTSLKLPAQFEPIRDKIEEIVLPVEVREVK